MEEDAAEMQGDSYFSEDGGFQEDNGEWVVANWDLASVQALIDELPDEKHITVDNYETVKAALQEIDAAKAELSDEQKGMLNIEKYMAAMGRLEELTGQEASDIPMLSVGEQTTVTNFLELQTAIAQADGTKDAPTEIVVSGTIDVTERLTISEGSYVKLTGDTLTCTTNNAFFLVQGTLILENITLEGKDHPDNCYMVTMSGGELILNQGAVLQNNHGTAIYFGGSGTLTMNDGEIKNNSDIGENRCGAAIFTGDNSKNTKPTINIHGGKITGNQATSKGGAIYITAYCDLNITGGEFSGNSADGRGGAIYINKEYTGNTSPVNITGGYFHDNVSPYASNIYTARDIVLGPDANISKGIALRHTSGEVATILLTEELVNSLGIEKIDSGSPQTANWLPVIKMKDGSPVSQATYEKCLIENPRYSLLLVEGVVRIGNPVSGEHQLDFTYTVWNGNSGGNSGIVGSQSGEGWNWNADDRILTITADVTAKTGDFVFDRALTLPENSKLVIEEGCTLSLESQKLETLYASGTLTIEGGGTLAVVCSTNKGNGGIYVSKKLTITDTKVEVTGSSEYYIRAGDDIMLDNCNVSINGVQNETGVAWGLVTLKDIVIQNSTVNTQLEMTENCTSKDEDENGNRKENAGVTGIATLYGNIVIDKSTVTIQTVNNSPDENSWNYGIFLQNGNLSISNDSSVTATVQNSSEPIGIAAVGKMHVDNSIVISKTMNSVQDGFALEMISYGGITLTGVSVAEGTLYEHEGEDDGIKYYEADITSSVYNPDDENSYPKGGTSIIRPLGTDTSLSSVTLGGTEGTITDGEISVLLPGGSALPTEGTAFAITPTDSNAKASVPKSSGDGSTWTFTVTAEDGTTEKEYSIKITIVPAEYTITFNPNGGTIASVTAVTTGGKLPSLPMPTYSGSYSFDGWYSSKTGGTKITTDTVFTEDTVLYARWTYVGGSSGGSGGGCTITCYNVTFDTQGGSILKPAEGIKSRSLLNPPEAPTRDGYLFVGWYKDADCTVPWDFARDTVTKHLTLYAKWTEAEKAPGSTSLWVKARSESTVTLGWTQVEDAMGYTIWYRSEYANHISRVIIRGGETTTWIHQSLAPGTKYFYTIRAWKKTDSGYLFGEQSKVQRGTTNPMPAVIRSVAVKNGKCTVKLEQEAAGAKRYAYCYSRTEDFEKFRVGIRSVYTTRTIPDVLPSGTYYVKVRSYRDLGNGKRVYGKWSKAYRVRV